MNFLALNVELLNLRHATKQTDFCCMIHIKMYLIFWANKYFPQKNTPLRCYLRVLYVKKLTSRNYADPKKQTKQQPFHVK